MKVKYHRRPLVIPKETPAEQVTLFDRIAAEVVHGDRATFDSLNKSEKDLVIKWLAEALATGKTDNYVHNVLWEIDYTRKPVDIETYITDKQYMGNVGEEVWPVWREELLHVFNPKHQYAEWLFSGGLGIGKTGISMLAMSYLVYLNSCLRNPARYYRLMENSRIVFGIYSVTMHQSADVGFDKLKGYFDSSPYFVNVYPRNQKLNSQVKFKRHNVSVILGSKFGHALGYDLLGICMDEANFFKEKNDKEKNAKIGEAYRLYTATRTRLSTRFMRPGGRLPGMVFLMSSRTHQTAFMEEHLKSVTKGTYRVGMKGEIAPNTYLSDFSIWEAKPKGSFIKPYFKVAVGNKYSPSRIMLDNEEPKRGTRVIEVPGDLRNDFELDVDQSLRDLAGVATFNISPFIRDRESIYDAIRKELFHPFTQEQIVVSDGKDDPLIQEFFEVKKVCRVHDSHWMPRIHPSAPRYIHVDTSLTEDSSAVVMAHPGGVVRTRKNNPDGTTSEVPMPFVVVDFILRINPPIQGEIDFSKIRSFILYLRQFYPIALVSFDGYQSFSSIQELRKEGVEADILSVDRTEDAYMALRATLFERRLSYYEYPKLLTELLDLERDLIKKKIDHPVKSSDGGKGSKDLSDALSAVTYHCMTDENAMKALSEEMVEGMQAQSPQAGVVEVKTPPIKVATPQDQTRTEVRGSSAVATAAPPKVKGLEWYALRKNVRK